MNPANSFFQCQKCGYQCSQEQFAQHVIAEKPIVPGSSIQEIKAKCPECDSQYTFSKDGKNDSLYPTFYYEDDWSPEDVSSAFEAVTAMRNMPDFEMEPPDFITEEPTAFPEAMEQDVYPRKAPQPPSNKDVSGVKNNFLDTIPKKSISAASPKRPRLDLTELGNSERLVRRHGENIRFSPTEGWYVWSGKRWEKDIGNIQVKRFAEDTTIAIKEEATKEPDKTYRKEIEKWGKASQQEQRIQKMIKLAGPKKGITIYSNQWDTDKWKINLENGTIDLNNFGFTPQNHNREDYITKIMPVTFSPIAQCKTWESFLNHIFKGDNELIRFLQRAVGYTLTGDTREQSIFFMYGKGANGKSTFIETIRSLLGDYAMNADFDTFLKKDGIRNDIARLKGARFVSAVEAGRGKEFAERIIKLITGGDTITARYLYKEYTEFNPTFKVFLAANHKPVIKGTDYAIWRRIL